MQITSGPQPTSFARIERQHQYAWLLFVFYRIYSEYGILDVRNRIYLLFSLIKSRLLEVTG